MAINENMELGVQPLDGIMTRLGLKNDDLVKASSEMLTHKMVKKGRHGRRLTLNVKQKILNALNAVNPVRDNERYAIKDGGIKPPSTSMNSNHKLKPAAFSNGVKPDTPFTLNDIFNY